LAAQKGEDLTPARAEEVCWPSTGLERCMRDTRVDPSTCRSNQSWRKSCVERRCRRTPWTVEVRLLQRQSFNFSHSNLLVLLMVC
jgi:hypothetical protein